MKTLRSTAWVTTIGLLVSLVGTTITAPPAAAAEPGIVRLVQTLDGATDSLQSWTKNLAEVGELGEALPAVLTSPGSVLGFSDLLHKWFNNGTHHVSSATTDADLNFGTEDIDLGATDGRSGTLECHLQTLGNGDKQLDLTIAVTKTVSDRPLTFPLPIGGASNAPLSAFSSHGGVNLTVSGRLSFRLVWNHSSDTVYVVVAGSTTPSIHVDASAHFADTAAVQAAIGILGVGLVMSTEITGSPAPRNRRTVRLMWRNWASRSGCCFPSVTLALASRL